MFLKDPEKYWELEREVTKMVEPALPNPAHKALVTLEQKGKLKGIITQNIDMLHQKAGSEVPIYELHGSAMTATCVDCETKFKREEILEQLEERKTPVCSECDGRVKFDVILFHEALPMHTLMGAQEITTDSDCFLVIGSSLVVSPANQLPILAKQSGAKVIILNLEETQMDEVADVIIHGKAGEIMPKLVNF